MGTASTIRKAPPATRRKAGHIQRLLEPGAIQPVYQPIVRLTDLHPVGYEGLARFPYADGLSHLPPDVTLAAAAELGLREELEVACWAAMVAAGSPPDGRLLFVNISPDALAHPGLFALAGDLPSRLVIEITEQSEVEDYAQLREMLKPWVARGAQVAIDDTGAGYASLQHVVELRPDFLKLTRSLVADIDRDANRQALLRALAAFAREVGAGIVAEGVERVEELEVLRAAQVDFAQGWLFGKPGAAWPATLEVASERPRLTDSGVRRLSGLERALAEASGPREACAAAVGHLRALGLMPSVYLMQGGRLRCQAAHGYWTVYDGMPPGAGVIGAAFRSGETTLIADVAAAPHYMSLVSAVQAEIAVPLRVGTDVVGVLNVEATTPLGDGPVREVERVADLLARRLGELGPLDRPSTGQRLARAATRAAAMEDPAAVIREAAAAAQDVSGLESVAVVMRGEDGRPEVRHATGPFAGVFEHLDAAALAMIASWVEEGASTCSMGDVAGRGPQELDGLRRSGAGAMVTVPLSVGGECLGFLALADRSNLVLATETTEMLELVGVQAAAQLRGLAAVSDVRRRHRPERDPLTGLPHRATLPSRLEAGAALILTDVDGLDGLNERRGHAAGDAVLRELAGLLEEVAPGSASAFRIGGDEFALVLDAGANAQEVAWQLQEKARDRLQTTLSIGVAVGSQLLERAGEALAEVKRRGRDGVALAKPR